MEQHARLLSGSAHQATKRLVHLGHAGNLIDAAEGRLAAESVPSGLRHTGTLHRIHFREGRTHDHRVSDMSAQRVDALSETGSEHEKKGVASPEGRLHP